LISEETHLGDHMRQNICILILITFVLGACNLPTGAATSTPVQVMPTATVIEAAPEPTIAPVLDLPTPTAMEFNPICVPPKAHERLNALTFDDYLQAVMLFVNSGGTPDELEEALANEGVASQPVAVSYADMTGDGKYDLVVSIFDPSSMSTPPEGSLMAYVCEGAQYKFTYLQESDEGWSAPGIRYLQDLNNDGAADLVSSTVSCGAHTCYERAAIMVWNGVTFENWLEGVSDDLPYPDIQVVDYDGDGFYDLEITGSGIGSVGAGPQRNLTRVWSNDPASGTWEVVNEIPGPSNYRIHALHDADTTVQRGEYEVGLALYNQVISDPNLEDWMDQENERLNIGAYARYKIVVLHTLLGQIDAAQAMFDDMFARYPEGTPQYAYVEMAAGYRSSYVSGGAEVACAAAMTYAAAHPEQVLAPLGSLIFGYGNPDYTPEDMCP
jgi:hypothetical protein